LRRYWSWGGSAPSVSEMGCGGGSAFSCCDCVDDCVDDSPAVESSVGDEDGGCASGGGTRGIGKSLYTI
jgi:hypothetical protein